MDQILAAYLAGYTDAEGCVRINPVHRASWQARLTFDQAVPDVLFLLYQILGGSLRERIPSRPGRLQASYALIARDDVLQFFNVIRPYMQIKAEQVDLVLKEFDTRISFEAGSSIQERLEIMKDRSIDVEEVPWTEDGHRSRSSIYRRDPTPTETAYTAGLLDGDGCFDVDEKRVAITLKQSDERGCLFLREIYGGTVRPEFRREPPAKPQAAYKLRARGAVLRLLREIEPHLIEKRYEANLILNRWTPRAACLEEIQRLLTVHRKREMPKGTVAAFLAENPRAALPLPGRRGLPRRIFDR